VVTEDEALEAKTYARYKPGEPTKRTLPHRMKDKEIMLPAVAEDAVMGEEDVLVRALDGVHTPLWTKNDGHAMSGRV
jgi:hypothetical protein